jgi:hypothetical protein
MEAVEPRPLLEEDPREEVEARGETTGAAARPEAERAERRVVGAAARALPLEVEARVSVD